MENNWKTIWNKKERIQNYILEMLIKSDGFDSGVGDFSVEDWKIYMEEIAGFIDLQPEESIFDVGCGSGAALYPLYLKKHKVGGADFSSVLLDLAKSIMKDCDFKNNEAINIDTKTKYNIVMSHGVFVYFKDLDYAQKVIEKMIAKANKKIAIFDLNDKSKEKEYLSIRKGSMSEEEYLKKYDGLEHFFYDKKWFEEIAKKHNLKINIFDQTFEKYQNSKLRFNVIMEK